VLQAQKVEERVVFHEGFEGGTRPEHWTQEKILGTGGSPNGPTVDWRYLNGGYGYDPNDPNDTGYPDHAYQGNYNAMFQLESYLGEKTILITPPLNIENVIKPELRFSIAQVIWRFLDPNNNLRDFHDELKVHYKRGVDSPWVELRHYRDPIAEWRLESILLPDSSLSKTYYIGFEGITGFGYGTCIDTVHIVETGVLSKFLNNYSIEQASTKFIPTEINNNPILKIFVDIQGNDGNTYLDSLKVTSLNTDDNDIANNGVKLYITPLDSSFREPVLIGNATNFEDGVAWFRNIHYDLPRGVSVLWVTYDIGTAANHDVHNHVVDAQIEANGIYINGNGFPLINTSPEGERLIKECIFNDGFETNLNWVLNGSFERGIPQGAGETLPGGPDPENALNGTHVLGTDLTGDGAYSNGLTNRQDSAITPTINCFYYKDVTVYYARWLNMETDDYCFLDLSLDNSSSWSPVWFKTSTILEDSWNIITHDLNAADFQSTVNLRFGVGPTSLTNQYTGINIDDFVVVGDFISRDVGVSEIIMPITSCGFTNNTTVQVKIKNYAGEATAASIPIRYTIDNRETYTTEAHNSSIAIGESAIYTFTTGANLAAPGFHTILVETVLPGDEIPNNNSSHKTVFSYPTHTIPYYEDFESNNGYYLSGGTHLTWEYGQPTGTIISTAASGTKVWGTNLDGSYLNSDSSFLETPCFNFAGTDSIVFEFKAMGFSEDKMDGLTLLYSLDQGTTWNVVPDDNDYYWNWYTENNIGALGLPGIDTTNGTWTTFRQLLPPSCSNQSNVKFRFLFESGLANRFEGFAIDDVRIYETYADVGISSINEPSSACEIGNDIHLEVYVENYGIIPIESGTKIPLEMSLNSETLHDTLTLASDFAVGSNRLFTFTPTVDLHNAGEYAFKIETKFESDQYFYYPTSNDTLYDTILVYGLPNFDPFHHEVGANPVTDITLDAGAGFTSYSWTEPSGTTPTTQTFNVIQQGIHYVTVTNDSNCTAIDSVQVLASVIDLRIDSLYTVLQDSCERIDSTQIKIHFINDNINSTVFAVNDKIALAYKINDNPIVADTLVVNSIINVGDTVEFTFNEKCNLISPGAYTLKVFTNILQDLNHANDTITKLVNTWGFADIGFEQDTIYSSRADTLVLDAGAGYINYMWNTSANTQTITPSNQTFQYIATVTEAHNCNTDSDTIVVQTHDFGVSAVTSPTNSCENTTSNNTNLTIDVVNYSNNIYSNTNTASIFYQYDNGAWQATTPSLTGGLNSLDTISLTIANIDNTNIGEHTLKVYTSSNIDANHTNDTLEYSFFTWALPDPSLTYDTIRTTRADTVALIADEGYVSYSWSDGSTNDTLQITDNYSHKYKVTVTDQNCGTATDSTQILTYDLSLSQMLAPESACENSNNSQVIVRVRNNGLDTINVEDTIPVGYHLIGSSPVMEKIVLTNRLLPDESTIYTFNQPVNVSNETIYYFSLFTQFPYEAKTSNDTLAGAVQTFGYPSIEIGDDIETSRPDTVLLVATPGFFGYYWNTGLQNDSLSVTYPATKTYEITVSNRNGCEASDDLTIYTYNIGTHAFNNPISACVASESEPVTITYVNNSRDTLFAGDALAFTYTINSGNEVIETFTLTDTLLPDSTGQYTFTQTANLSSNGTYQFNVLSKRASNDINLNDGISQNVEIDSPTPDFGRDTIKFNTSAPLILSDTYDSYAWSTGATTASITVTETGTYTVTVTNSLNCVGIGSVYCLKNVVGINDLIGKDYSISYYPNPAIDKLNIKINNRKPKDIKVEIINTQGQIVHNKKYHKIQRAIESINVNSFPEGFYHIRFTIDDKIFTRKVIIQ
ncbi:MAG: T9SS type A sorting domain-containing protein, partial [Bacteroidales bacterium]|nr:T9SS type A sorting domain-containing protein [Bacteroidales bacterium]